MTTTIIILAIILCLFFFLRRKNKPAPKDVELPSFNNEENLNEPIFSYSVYTVDVVLNHRYLNYTHKDFPNHVGILKGQYLEIEWNILNADLITISGIGLVKAVGRKAFYPSSATQYTITAKNKEYELSQTIYVRVFPVNTTEHLFTRMPNVRIQSQQMTTTPEVTKLPAFTVDKPVLNAVKPAAISLHEVLQDKIVTKSFTQKINDYLSLNKPTNKK